MFLLDHILGKPLCSSEDRIQKVGSTAGIAVFGFDALGSTAYGPEAALTILIPLGTAIHWVVPISVSILILRAILCFSYLQTIPACPGARMHRCAFSRSSHRSCAEGGYPS